MNIHQEILLLANEDRQLDKTIGNVVYPIKYYIDNLYMLYIKGNLTNKELIK